MAVVGGYAAAKGSSPVFENYTTGTTDADSSVKWGQRLTLVDRGRQQVRDVPVGRAIINRTCDHAVGQAGLTLHPQVDRETLGWSEERARQWEREAKALWREWAESKESDLERTQNFQQKTYLTLQSMLEGGDCFTIFTNKKRSGSDFNLKLQTIEGERVSNPNWQQDTETLIEGVEKDSDGAPKSYHISKFHPGNAEGLANQGWDERSIFGSTTGRRNILHHYNVIRPGQTRGIPILGPVTDKLVQIGRLTNAELLAAVINSFYTLIYMGDPGSTKVTKLSPASTKTPKSTDKIEMGAGQILRAPDGVEDIKSFDPQRPSHRFEPFFKAIVAEIGAAIGVPRSLILMSFDKSFSASRGEVLLAWVYFLSKRTDIKVSLCQPTYEAFLDEAISRGMLAAPGYFLDSRVQRAFRGSAYDQWTGPIKPAFNELQEAQAHSLRIKNGTATREDITSETSGRDWDLVHEQLKRELELRKRDGLETDFDIPGIGGA
jgi:lambda family phage portal protein